MQKQRLFLPPENLLMSLIYLVYLNKVSSASTLDFCTRTVNALIVLANRVMTSVHSCRCNSPDFVSEYTLRAGPGFSVSQDEVT
jgi:hypothetical protein